MLRRKKKLELLLSFIGTSRKTKQCGDRQNGGAVNTGESKRGGGLNWSQLWLQGSCQHPVPVSQSGMGSSDSALGEWQEQTLPEILAINGKVLTHALQKP